MANMGSSIIATSVIPGGSGGGGGPDPAALGVLGKLADSLTKLTDAMEQLTKAAALPKLDTLLTNLDANLTKLGASIDKLDNSFVLLPGSFARLTTTIGALITAILSSKQGKKGAGKTPKADPLDQLTERFDTLWTRLHDGRTVTQGSIDRLEDLYNRIDKLGTASTELLGSYSDHISAISMMKKFNEANEESAKAAKKAAAELVKEQIRGEAAQKQLFLDQQAADAYQKELWAEHDAIVAEEAAALAKVKEIVESITTAIARAGAAANITSRSIYDIENKIKRLGKLDPQAAAGITSGGLADLFKEKIKRASDAMDAAQETASKYYIELLKGDNITETMINKFKSMRETFIKTVEALNKANVAAFGANAPKQDVSQFLKNTEAAVQHLRDSQKVNVESRPKEAGQSGLSKIMATIGTSIVSRFTSAIASSLTQPLLVIVGQFIAPFKEFIAVIVSTVGVLIRYFFVVTGILGWLKRMELSLAAFSSRVTLASDMMLSLDTAVKRASVGIATSVDGLGSDVVSALDNALMNPLTGFADIVNRISRFVELVNPGLMEQYNRVMENLMAMIGSALQPVVIEITNLMYQFGTQLKPVIEFMGGYLAKAVRGLAMAIIPLIPQIIMGLTQLAVTLIGFVANMGITLAESTGGPLGDPSKGTREERIKEEEYRLNAQTKHVGSNKNLNERSSKEKYGGAFHLNLGSTAYGEQADEGRRLNKKRATMNVDREIKAELAAIPKQPPKDFMDSAVAKNAQFTSGMDMGKSSIQKAFERSSAYGVAGGNTDDAKALQEAQMEFYKNPSGWMKKAFAGVGAPPMVRGGVGGAADGGHLNPLQKINMAGQLIGAMAGGVKQGAKDLSLGLIS